MAAYMESLTVLVISLFFTCFAVVLSSSDDFNEELLIKPLESGHVYNHFQFTTTWDVNIHDQNQFKHYHLFPKPLGEVLAKYHVQELHLTQTQGLWRYEKWGYPVEDAGPGAELWVWFQPGTPNIDETWTDLINVLSGMFCSSLNFMDSKNTVIPKLSFRPKGVTTHQYDRRLGSNIRYAALPSEMVCTENLTPWKKLLPCGSKSGLASLFQAKQLYDSSYHSLGIHYRPICKNTPCNETIVELSQTLDAVFDPTVSPQQSNDWSMKQLFGKRLLSSACPLATSSKVYVDLAANRTDYHFTLNPPPSKIEELKRGSTRVRYAMYNIPDFIKSPNVLNIALKYNRGPVYGKIPPPILHAHRFQTGYGQEKGGIMTLIYNEHPSKLVTVSIMEVIPWYLRTYLHTLKVEAFDGEPGYVGVNGTKLKPLHMHYIPGKDRVRPHQLELVLSLPADSITRVSCQFDRALLKWTEYPPDANHGFYVNSAVISTVVPTARNYTSPPQTSSMLASILTDDSTSFFVRIHTESLLVSLPTPDFSMPYNVICLACTVVAIAFGSIHNLTTRRFTVLDPKKKKGLLAKIKAKLFRKKAEQTTTENETPKEEVKGEDCAETQGDNPKTSKGKGKGKGKETKKSQ